MELGATIYGVFLHKCLVIPKSHVGGMSRNNLLVYAGLDLLI